MTSFLTKSYEFSASYSEADKVVGHNYVLRATFEACGDGTEETLDKKIQDALIKKIHSSDLGQHVDFLKNKQITDLSLLRSFWPLVAQAALPARLERLSLERDRTTQWALTAHA